MDMAGPYTFTGVAIGNWSRRLDGGSGFGFLFCVWNVYSCFVYDHSKKRGGPLPPLPLYPLVPASRKNPKSGRLNEDDLSGPTMLRPLGIAHKPNLAVPINSHGLRSAMVNGFLPRACKGRNDMEIGKKRPKDARKVCTGRSCQAVNGS